MANINLGAAVFGAQVVRVQRESQVAISVALRFVQDVSREKTHPVAAQPARHRDDQLILIEPAGGFILINVTGVSKRPDAAVWISGEKCSGQWCIDIPRAQQM